MHSCHVKKPSHNITTLRVKMRSNLHRFCTAINQTIMTTLKFERLTPTPDATLKTTPLARSSHGLSALSNGNRLVLYGGENVARTPIADAILL